jgi:type II secretory pathway pseudopilin PulG
VEVLASLILMAILIPVGMQGMGIVSRAAVLGQRKVEAMRIAEKVINEQLAVVAAGQPVPTTGNGTETDAENSYPWTMATVPWAEDTMTQMTVTVTFTMQGSSYEMTLSTLFDPNAAVRGTPSAITQSPG